MVYGVKISIPRENHVCELIDGDKIILAGGWSANKSLTNIDIFKYDKQKDTLRKLDANQDDKIS